MHHGFRGYLGGSVLVLFSLFPTAPLQRDSFRWAHLQFFAFSSGLLRKPGSGGGGDVAPSPRKFVACVRHGLKNTRVALAELATTPGSSVCCSNSSGGR